ncbi:ribosomal protection-like ABC-F family protein [Candidatus Amarobacter glycogenicus]|jgi:ATP-binding cassette subfamily F protein 3|uniref:ribosomal protection-like ABC-F family protein n=1 Tax=Candidatus Amarobacter glycogenicus TaxID=3140699 RepID=UPI003135AB71|nr:ABC-F family ATP-binding cassette domain-containing protein [Dehalococcoidia bacterium]
MIVADLASVSRVHGGRTIFRGLSWSLQDGEKIGLVGPSGWGKTTLIKLLAGEDAPDAGAVTLRRGARVAYLPQDFAGQPGRTAFEELLASSADIAELEAACTAAEQQLADPATLEDPDTFDRVLHEHADLLERYEKAGGGAVRNRAEALLRSLGFDEDAWARPMELLSGGQRKLIGIARCLLAEPDLLLLDEPDNHLDLERKTMLEKVIRQFPGCAVVISHDRYLLDEVANVICELDYSREEGIVLRRWEGNYTSYVSQKELALLRQQQQFVAQQKEIERLEAAIARFKLWASIVIDERHIKQARNKQRQIDSMDKVERPVLERRKMRLSFRPSNRGGAKTLELRHLAKAFGAKVILRDADEVVLNGERIGIVGPNGAGKSVLLKLILGQLPADSGEVWVGPSVRTGYYAQEHETLNMRQTPVEAIREVKPMYEGEAVAQLQRFLLPYAATSQPIAKLSGGEKSRVQLARLMQLGANCLVLDEPTNNLDIPAAEVLEEALESFPGTVIVVSHDRYLLDRLVDRVIEVRDGRIRSFAGGYSNYLEQVNAPPVIATASEAHAGERAKAAFQAKRRRG